MCDFICAAPDGLHKCHGDDFYERFASCDLARYSEHYDEIDERTVKCFPCKKCSESFQENEELKEHFKQVHTKEDLIKCPVEKCDHKTKSIEFIIMHIGLDHKDLVEKQ